MREREKSILMVGAAGDTMVVILDGGSFPDG